MPLNLTQRKSLKDYEKYLTGAIEKIKKVYGTDWSFEIDFETILPLVGKNDIVNNPGSYFYAEAVDYCADNLVNSAKNPTIKEAIENAITNRKVVFRVSSETKGNYWYYTVEDGSLILWLRVPTADVSVCASFPLDKVIPMGSGSVYDLPTLLNIKENKDRLDQALVTIKDATKTTGEWTIDGAALEAAFPLVTDKEYKNYFGSLIREATVNASNNLKEKCSDDMVREAFVEATSTRTIIYQVDETLKKYWEWSFANGALVIKFKGSRVANCSDNAYYNFIDLL